MAAPGGRAVGLFWAAALMLLLALATPAWASDRIVERQLLEDPTGQLDITAATEKVFGPAPRILSAGYSDSAFWLRLTVAPETPGATLLLRVWPTFLDNLTLYAPDGAGGWSATTMGDAFPLSDRLATVSFGFPIAPLVPTTYYLRLKTSSSSLMAVDAVPPDVLFAGDLSFGLFGAVCVGLMLAMLVWGTNALIASRESLLAIYVVSQVIAIFYGFAVTGYLAVLFPTLVLDGATNFLVCAATFTQLFFHVWLLRGFDVPRPAIYLTVPLVALGLTTFVCLALGQPRLALQLNAVDLLAAPPVITLLAFLARRDAPPGRWALRLAGLFQTATLLTSAVPLSGLSGASLLTQRGVLLHGALSGLIAFLILKARADQQRRAALEHERARIAFDVERREHDVRGRFLALLSHELKTPLSVIRLSLPAIPPGTPARARVDGAVDSMIALIDLATCAERLDQGELPVTREQVALDDVLRRLAAEPAAAGRLRLGALPTIALESDPNLLDVVLRNLVDNALKYSPPQSEVTIVVSAVDCGGRNGVSILVENEPDRGMPDPARVFDKFHRGAGTSGKTGLGLGLYVVRGVAELLGASVDCEIADSRVRFTVLHPC
jgi:signal transduction histidine kinase